MFSQGAFLAKGRGVVGVLVLMPYTESQCIIELFINVTLHVPTIFLGLQSR